MSGRKSSSGQSAELCELHQSTAASTWWCGPRPRLGWVEMAVGLPEDPSYPGHSPFYACSKVWVSVLCERLIIYFWNCPLLSAPIYSSKVHPSSVLSYVYQVVNIVNFLKTSAFTTRLFKLLCEELRSDHTSLPCRIAVAISRKCDKTCFELRAELFLFFIEKITITKSI